MSPAPQLPPLRESVYIDRKTGKQTRTFLVGDKPCPKIALSSAVACRYAGYVLIKVDLLDAKAWLNEAYGHLPKSPPPAKAGADRYWHTDDKHSFKIVKALWFAALVIYGKCFTKAEGRRAKLERTSLPAQVRAYHDEIMTLRHTIVAHAGNAEHEIAQLYLVLDPRPKRSRYWLRSDVKRLDFSDDRRDPVSFEMLIDFALGHVVGKINEIEGHIREKELFPHPIEYWYDRASSKRA